MAFLGQVQTTSGVYGGRGWWEGVTLQGGIGASHMAHFHHQSSSPLGREISRGSQRMLSTQFPSLERVKQELVDGAYFLVAGWRVAQS